MSCQQFLVSQLSAQKAESVRENESIHVGEKLTHNSVLKNVQCLEPLKVSSHDELLTLSLQNEIENIVSENEHLKVEKKGKNVHLKATNVRSDSNFLKVDKIGEEFVLSTPVTGIDSTLNYESGKLTVNLEGIFSRAGAMTASTNRVDLKRPKAPIFLQHGALMLDLDEFSALNVVRTGLTILLKSNGGLEQDASGLRLHCAPPLVIENNILRFTQSRFLLKGRGTTTTFKNYGNLFTKEDVPYSRIDYGLSQDRNSVASGVKSFEAKTIKVTANVRGAGGKVIIATQIQTTPGVYTLSRNILFEVNANNECLSTTILHDFSQNETCIVLSTVVNAPFSLLLEEIF